VAFFEGDFWISEAAGQKFETREDSSAIDVKNFELHFNIV
jgi:hypothetical protein